MRQEQRSEREAGIQVARIRYPHEIEELVERLTYPRGDHARDAYEIGLQMELEGELEEEP